MKTKYSVTGLDCPNCAAKLEGMLSKTEGIDAAKINFLSEKLTVESELPENELFDAVKKTALTFSAKVKVERL